MVVCIRDDSLLLYLCKYYKQLNNNSNINTICDKILKLLNKLISVRKGVILYSKKIELTKDDFPSIDEVKKLFNENQYFIEAYCNFIRCLFFNMYSYYEKIEECSHTYIFLLFYIKDIFNYVLTFIMSKDMNKEKFCEFYTTDPKKIYFVETIKNNSTTKKSTSKFSIFSQISGKKNTHNQIRSPFSGLYRYISGNGFKKNEEYFDLNIIIEYYKKLNESLKKIVLEIDNKFNDKTNLVLKINNFTNLKKNNNKYILIISIIIKFYIKFFEYIISNILPKIINDKNNTTLKSFKYPFIVDFLFKLEYMSLKICRRLSLNKLNKEYIEEYIRNCSDIVFNDIKRCFIRNLFVRQPNDYKLNEKISLYDSHSLLYMIININKNNIKNTIYKNLFSKMNNTIVKKYEEVKKISNGRIRGGSPDMMIFILFGFTFLDVTEILSVPDELFRKRFSNKSLTNKKSFTNFSFLEWYYNRNRNKNRNIKFFKHIYDVIKKKDEINNINKNNYDFLYFPNNLLNSKDVKYIPSSIRVIMHYSLPLSEIVKNVELTKLGNNYFLQLKIINNIIKRTNTKLILKIPQ
jgi:hypothetical protein